MLNRSSNKKSVTYQKSTAFQHNINLLEQAQKSILIDEINLTNSADITANKAVFLIHFKSNIEFFNFEIIHADVVPVINIYPNGIIQLNFEDMLLQPGKSIKLTYRIQLKEKKLNKDDIIERNYLFFCF